MQQRSQWVEWFATLFDVRVPALFLTGLMLTAVFGNAAFGLLVLFIGDTAPALIVIMLLAVVALIGVTAGLGLVQRARRRALPKVKFEQQVAPHRGLILCVSAGDEGQKSARRALEHHCAGGVLAHAWLLTSDAAQKTAAALAADFGPRGVAIDQRPVKDPLDAPACYALAQTIIAEATGDPVLPIEVGDMIVDITGGTRPMATGAMMAAQAAGCAMQYMVAPRDARGEIIAGAQSAPMLVQLIPGRD